MQTKILGRDELFQWKSNDALAQLDGARLQQCLTRLNSAGRQRIAFHARFRRQGPLSNQTRAAYSV